MPAKATLAEILQAHLHAQGTPPPGYANRTEDWSLTIDGTAATLHRVFRGDDNRTDVTIGSLHAARGRRRGRTWSQDYSGQVVASTGIHHADALSVDALEAAHPVTGLALLGQVDAPVSAYVVKVAPPGGRFEYAYFDRKTGLIDRIEAAQTGRRVVTIYDDFRATGGYTRPWHERIETPDGVQDERITALQIGATIADADLAQPVSTQVLSFAAPRVALPAKILADRVIVTVRIDGRAINLQLDSGASGILLDQRVADALHLAQVGTFEQTVAGTYDARLASLPAVTLGDVQMTGAVAETAPFEMWADEKTPVAGLLGFDFLSGCVLHVDYADGTVEAIDAKTFVPPPGAATIPIALDDRVPAVSAIVGGASGSAFVVDTGADRSLLFEPFVAAHPKETADRGLGDEERDAFPFTLRLSGVGGTMSYRLLQVAPFSFAGFTFPQWLFGAPDDPAAFDVEDYDGLIGQDVLRNFDVYFDYPQLRIYIVPNARYTQRWG